MSDKHKLWLVAVLAVVIGYVFSEFDIPSRWILG